MEAKSFCLEVIYNFKKLCEQNKRKCKSDKFFVNVLSVVKYSEL